MQPGTRKLLRFLQSWVINTLAVLIAALILRGHIRYGDSGDLIIASLFLGILNAFVRPILMLLALPLVIFTLGLFTFVINALMLYGVGWMMGLLGLRFTVDSFWSAFVGAIIISVVSVALNVLTGSPFSAGRRKIPPAATDR
jgi:putative membrane protein